MPRPALRPMRALPVLEGRRAALETCTFCPKLCRTACPVSNAEPRETLTPWGKMAGVWMAAHGDVPTSASHAQPAWACTACGACTSACDHRNPAGDVLVEARSALAREGAAPAGAQQVLSGFDRHQEATRAAARALTSPAASRPPTALVIGCGYLRKAPAEARDALEAARGLLGPVHVVDACCGLPLKLAGDGGRFEAHARATARSLAAFDAVVVVDPGCGVALRKHFPAAGARIEAPVELLVEAAARKLPALTRIEGLVGDAIRWHDPCQLGRGLGIYDAPRSVLARVAGGPVGELRDSRDQAPCSGAGGLLPCTMPDAARTIADARLEEHRVSGGGRIVTGCASSLIALRKRAAPSGLAVDDLVTYVARALEPKGAIGP